MLLLHRGGLRFGALAGLFYAVQQVSSIARAEKGLQDIIVAGTATGAVFGATGEQLLLPFLAVGPRSMSSATHTYANWVPSDICGCKCILRRSAEHCSLGFQASMVTAVLGSKGLRVRSSALGTALGAGVHLLSCCLLCD